MTDETYTEEDQETMAAIMRRKIVYHEKAALIYKKGLEMLKNA